MQSVPRVVSYSPELEILLITPIAELAQLRTGLLHASASPLALGPNATTVRGAAGATLDIAVNFTCPPAAPARSVGLAAAASSEHLGTPRPTTVLNDTNLEHGDIGAQRPAPAPPPGGKCSGELRVRASSGDLMMRRARHLLATAPQ
jgi:hypothetical protein